MITTIEHIRADIEELRKTWEANLEEAQKEEQAKAEELRKAGEELEALLDKPAGDKAQLNAKMRYDVLALQYNNAASRLRDAKEKKLATEEDGRQILREIEAVRSQAYADTLAEIWQAFMTLEKAADKYAELSRKCTDTLLYYNDYITPVLVPIGSRDGKPVYKDREKLAQENQIDAWRYSLRGNSLYRTAKQEAEKRGMDTETTAGPVRNNWV